MAIDWQRLKPKYWFQNEPTDWVWDGILNNLLDTHTPKHTTFSRHVVVLGGIEVWSSNWPYAYGSSYRPNRDGLPSVATRKRLRDAVRAADEAAFLAAIEKAIAE